MSAALRFFAEGSYQKGVGNDYSVALAEPATSKSMTQIADVLESELCSKEIKFPATTEDKTRIKTIFNNKFGLAGAIGGLDGTHEAEN